MSDFPGAPTRPGNPTAQVSLLHLILAGLEAVDGDSGGLAHRAGLPAHVLAGSSARVPTEYLGRLWGVGLARSDDPGLGVKVAGQWRFGMLHLTDYMFGIAATLGEAITEMVQYSALASTSANEVRLSAGGDGSATVTYQVQSGDSDVDAVASQFALGTVLVMARHALGREIRPVHVGLASAAPRSYRELAGRFGARRIDFGAERFTVTLAPADLSIPLPGADAQLAAVLRQYAADAIAAQTATSTWADLLRRDIAVRLAEDGLSLSAAARRLAVSPRSLQRRLGEEGTSWREVVDGVRRDRAAVLLGRGLSRKAVAARLGFSDARALRGALFRWSGESGASSECGGSGG